jgi:hypothetical protein
MSIKHIWQRSDGSFYEINFPESAPSPAPKNVNDILRYNGNGATVPQSLTDEIIDSEPANPDWQEFRLAFISDSYWATWAGQIGIAPALALTSAATLENVTAFQQAYDIAVSVQQPPAGARATWQGYLEATHITGMNLGSDPT